ncbi:MAG: hypothetical protein KDN19_07355 [Verrucomicrobiae bacterium]|nr:hypothetical protein [Verrucomicrobiae bacterium]
MNGSALQGSSPGFQQIAIPLIWWGGILLIFIGLLKLAVYAIGELRPNTFAGIKSETLRRFFTGKNNRLVFGLGGFLTSAVGGFFMVAAKVLAVMYDRLPH